MSNKKSVAEKTSADDKSIGFEYQYYYFLEKLLNLRGGQSVGLEVQDDVHIEFDADLLVLFQLKHTVRKAADGQPIALPELDIDIWKTIHNWSNVITDQTHNRGTSAMQLAFVRKTEFHLVTNKTQSKANKFLGLLEDLKRGIVDFLEVKSCVQSLHDRTEDTTIKGYIKTLLELNDSVAEQFIKHIFVELALNDIIARVKACIRDKFIDENRINEVFERLDSNIRQDNFIAIKTGKPVLISYEQFMQKYRNIFVDGRSKALPAPTFTPILPDKIFGQLFIRRLMEIEALAPEDVERATDYTLLKLRVAHYLESWVQTGDLISDEVNALHKEVFRRWSNKFQFAFRKCTSMQDVVDTAIGMLVELREERFKVGPSELDTDLSNGELYYLSDGGQIGWHRDWETL